MHTVLGRFRCVLTEANLSHRHYVVFQLSERQRWRQQRQLSHQRRQHCQHSHTSTFHFILTNNGHVNNVLCYFPRLAADVRYKLFGSYCSRIFGCELCHLTGSNVDTFCTAWRSGLRRVWKLPNTTHSDDLAIFDELWSRSLMFKLIDKCFFHSSNLLKFVIRCGVLFGRYKSAFGSNFHFCAARFNNNNNNNMHISIPP